jgi:hypothetical protein
MRKFLIGAIAAVTAMVTIGLAGTNDSQAAPYSPNPWCLKASMGKGWVVDLCYFRTFAECARERFFYGNTSFCVNNPEYVFAKAQQEEQRRARRNFNQ